ncbi:N-acetylmuramoyl-L-alanine amidase family protein [Paenibacillus donghaensis]|uniref:N-acetylmuramoyl-L-alanine amidase n=1 Tax=Paenibacillus donghaensis TaxID=414771 RepID=A0A2Z2KTP0_9BACL|nr:N-acetylmuramoyl-L-alanine amidase family protein [Paenibacillus donghaensis]ASA22858.1 N-acetylmuramoyl-L-alanine amidase [Paenibacillus donghaensis]
MKKLGCMLLVLLFVWFIPQTGHAAAVNSKIVLDGKELKAGQNTQVENVNGTVMVPLRMIAENLGYKVGWNQQSKTITIEQEGKIVRLAVNQTAASVDDKTLILTEAPVLRTDTTLVPIRFIGEQFGLTVNWDNTAKIVDLITPEIPADNGGAGTGEATPSEETTSNLALVNGLSFNENRLSIAISGNTDPAVSKITGPNRIVIDLPNTTFSDLFGTGQLLSPDLNGSLAVTGHPDVSGVRYSLYNTSPYTVRFVIDLNSAKNYNVNISGDDSSRLIVIDLNAANPADTTTQPGNSGRKQVVLDAGHGAKDSGAVGVTGKYEKNVNLAIVLKAAALLKQENNIDVVLTRSDDTFLELKERAAIANNLQADLFISVHSNSGSTAASGTETYYQRESSKAFAAVMHKYLVQATGLSDRGVRYGNFHVIRETKMPAVLLEIGYLSNKKDEALLFTEELQNKVAASMVKGIKEYLGLK